MDLKTNWTSLSYEITSYGVVQIWHTIFQCVSKIKTVQKLPIYNPSVTFNVSENLIKISAAAGIRNVFICTIKLKSMTWSPYGGNAYKILLEEHQGIILDIC
jgi:hypothetical protein